MPPHFFWRARVLAYDTAIRADVDQQDYTVAPRHWYIDAKVVCDACGKVFLFSAAEQRVWYEEYRFYVYSFPRKCVGCRRAARHMKDLRQQYDAQIAEVLRGRDKEMKENLVEIIDALQAGGVSLDQNVWENRHVLLRQLAKLAEQP